MDGQKDRQKDIKTYECTERLMDGQMVGWMDRNRLIKDRWMDRNILIK